MTRRLQLLVQLGSAFVRVYCSQCGGEFGPRDGGYSHCEDHKVKKAVRK